jgi:FkbM family methyltransferase
MKNFLDKFDNIKGIIQIGANSGQEVPLFKTLTKNIILVEPIPRLAEQLKTNHPTCLVVECAAGSLNTKSTLHIASNNGESSSILTPADHKLYYPGVIFNQTIEVNIKRFDEIIYEHKIDMQNFNTLITDTQGYDLEAIKGFGQYITNIELIICEYINSNLYQNNAS